MNIQHALEAALQMPNALAASCARLDCSKGGRCTACFEHIDIRASVLPGPPLRLLHGRWIIAALVLASGLLVASCVGTDQTIDSHRLSLASADTSDTQATDPVAQNEARHPPTADPFQNADDTNLSDSVTSESATPLSAADHVTPQSTSFGVQRVLLRPINNISAGDLLDHWGYRHRGPILARLSPVHEFDGDDGDSGAVLAVGDKTGTESSEADLQDDEAFAVLGQRRGVTYGRRTDGPADTLSIEFDLQYAPEEMQHDWLFQAALQRAGKVWSQRIDDTWETWEREEGESKAVLIGNYGSDGAEIVVGPGGETSTGVLIYITGVDLESDLSGWGGPDSLRWDADWEPHAGKIAFDKDYRRGVEESGEASLFYTMVHEIGHVLGAWYGYDANGLHWPFVDTGSGNWTGPRVEAVHDGPAPFQDKSDEFGWHNGERRPEANDIDYYHSGVCESVMAYCTQRAAIPAFLPAEIDFAFLADLGLTIRPAPDRPETYRIFGLTDYSIFEISVSRALDVSLADPQARYFDNGASWTNLDTVDHLWADAVAFGEQSTGDFANSFPNAETVRYAGGLIGTAVDYPGLPPVYGDANLSIDLNDRSEDNLTGKASFTSLQMSYNGYPSPFGDGSLHYPIIATESGIRDGVPGVFLVADFYGPRHEEVAGTLDDIQAGLFASFGAKHDPRPTFLDVIMEADHVRGMRYRDDFDENAEDGDGWYRVRCGEGPVCEENFEWWESGSDWTDVSATESRTPRERVLSWTAGWGDWITEDLHTDSGAIRVARRHHRTTDAGTGRYQQDGYFGTMEYAAFGTGFFRFSDWHSRDGGNSDFFIRGTGFQGDLSGTRPAGSATWLGHMLGYQDDPDLEAGEDPFVQGHARVRVSLLSNLVDIGFSNVRSMDRERELEDFGYDDIPLASDGTFDRLLENAVEGAFFGPEHQEVAGMFFNLDNHVTGSFGAVQSD